MADCEKCGSLADVTFGPDPFAEEIHHDSTPVWMCNDCRDEAIQEI